MLAALIVAATLAGGVAEDPDTAAAKAAIERNLVDPESVQYRDVKVTPGVGACGRYNAKNSFGGYDGFQGFAYLSKRGALYTEREPGSDVEEWIWTGLAFQRLGCESQTTIFSSPDAIVRQNARRTARGEPPIDFTVD